MINVTPSAYEFPLLIKQLLISPVARVSTREIVYADRQRYDYPGFIRRVARLAHMLDRLMPSEAGTVSVMDWDSHRYLECYFAVPMTGRVLHTVNTRLSPEQMVYTLNHARCELLIVHRELLPMIKPFLHQLDTVKVLVSIDESGEAPDERFAGNYESLMSRMPEEYDFPDFDERRQATLFYTSGTTGRPKGVYYSHRQMVLHALTLLATFGTAPTQGRVCEDDVYMPITPMFHAHAWGWPYAATLLGMKQVYLGRYTPQKVLATIQREKVTFSHCVATLLQMVLTEPGSEKVDLRGLKMLIGGGALPVGLAKDAMQRGIDVFTAYGMSETGPVQVLNQLTREEIAREPDQQALLRTRAGRPALLCDVRAVDDALRPVPRDGKSVGEIVFRSPWLTQGYFNNPEASEELWQGGWLHSNDLGFVRPDGTLHITDRIKDVIKTGGEWVSSLELESLTSRHPAVREAAFIAVPDEKWGERPMALIILKEEQVGKTDAESIRTHLRAFADQGLIPRYAVPDRVEFVESLDKTSVGKLDKKALRSRFVG